MPASVDDRVTDHDERPRRHGEGDIPLQRCHDTLQHHEGRPDRLPDPGCAVATPPPGPPKPGAHPWGPHQRFRPSRPTRRNDHLDDLLPTADAIIAGCRDEPRGTIAAGEDLRPAATSPSPEVWSTNRHPQARSGQDHPNNITIRRCRPRPLHVRTPRQRTNAGRNPRGAQPARRPGDRGGRAALRAAGGGVRGVPLRLGRPGRRPPRRPGPERLLREQKAGFGCSTRRIHAHLDDTPEFFLNQVTQVVMDRWSSGRWGCSVTRRSARRRCPGRHRTGPARRPPAGSGRRPEHRARRRA